MKSDRNKLKVIYRYVQKNLDYGRQEGRKSQSPEGLQSEGLSPIAEEKEGQSTSVSLCILVDR